jgi:peptidyl-prolyl cis-trans isomerase SurA
VKKWSFGWGGRQASSLIKLMRKYALYGVGAALLMVLPSFFPLTARADQIVDRVVATVDGDPITMRDLRKYAQAAGTTLPADGSPQSEQVERKVLNDLIRETIMDHEMSAIEVDDDQVDRYIAQFEAGNHISDAELREQLAQHGIPYEAYRKRARLEVQKMTFIQEHVRDKINVTETMVQAYYHAHLADFTSSQERFKLAQILVAADPTTTPPVLMEAARAKAEALRRRALKGEDFSQLAAQYSDDDSKTQGGELGYFKPDEINEQILAAISKLKSGGISPVVKTNHGFHVIKVEQHEEAGVVPLKDVRDRIREKLAEQQMKTHFKSWVDSELMKNHSVQTYL